MRGLFPPMMSLLLGAAAAAAPPQNLSAPAVKAGDTWTYRLTTEKASWPSDTSRPGVQWNQLDGGSRTAVRATLPSVAPLLGSPMAT